jgi:hypothetical protein
MVGTLRIETKQQRLGDRKGSFPHGRKSAAGRPNLSNAMSIAHREKFAQLRQLDAFLLRQFDHNSPTIDFKPEKPLISKGF